jgi:DNA-binding SARP family transcriptional activator
MTAPEPLRLSLLGELELARGGKTLALPASKKTRALLAYLAVTGKPHRRDRLCTLFWDLPDDPRGALRWSLSKLRGLVDEPARPRIAGSRDTVAFDSEGVEIDMATARRQAEGNGAAPLEALKHAAALFRGEFLEGLDLASCPEFEAWRAAEREEARALHRRVLVALVERLAATPAEALPHARTLVGIDPYAPAAHESLLKLLVAAGRQREAAEQFAVSTRILAEASTRSAGALAEFWRALDRVRSEAPPPAEVVVPPAEPERRRAARGRAQTMRVFTATDGARSADAPGGPGRPRV